MADHRARFEAFCRSLTPEELATPVPDAPWTVHGYIAHLATIEALINRFFGRMVGVQAPEPEIPPPSPFDLDDWNEGIVARRPDATLEELFAEAAENRAVYVRILEALPEEAKDMMVPFGGDRRKIDLPPVQLRLQDLLTSIALHDPNHTHDIIRALPQREPDVHDWLAEADYANRSHPDVRARRA
jgi:hypothetical protein